jgi:hypothetical protein
MRVQRKLSQTRVTAITPRKIKRQSPELEEFGAIPTMVVEETYLLTTLLLCGGLRRNTKVFESGTGTEPLGEGFLV